MAQSIQIANATYPDVPSIVVHKVGSGTAGFFDVSDTTAAAADVAQGKYFYAADGTRTQGTASGGGGGSSNVVAGTFKGTTAGAINIPLNYSGNGYPLAISVWVKDGTVDPNSSFYSLVQRYATASALITKKIVSSSPTYTGSTIDNQGVMVRYYKSSTSNPTSYTTGYYDGSPFNNVDASAGNNNFLKIKSKTAMSVYVAGSGHAFALDVEYAYAVIYSS